MASPTTHSSVVPLPGARELLRALSDHELVKVSARVGERAARDAALDELARRTSSVIVQRIGHVGV